MKTCTYFLAWLFSLPWALRAEALPIVFARSGQKVTFPVSGDDGQDRSALWLSGPLASDGVNR